MVQLGLDAVLSGTPSTICKTKVCSGALHQRPRAPRSLASARGSAPRPPPAQVVCTLGPKSRTVEVLEELLRAGLNVARFNFSHGTHEYHQAGSDGAPAVTPLWRGPRHGRRDR
jgi:pyruvate kinase